ncbi:MAG: alpha/beta hydrolase [Spirochaetaceae bacterium]|nr:alpha/beta hydrolase [Spirochaetaceae bacterium]
MVFRTDHAQVNGIVIVAHGLNTAPSRMGSPEADGTIVKALLDGGYHVVRAAFTGHRGVIEEMRSVTTAAWLDDAHDCVLAARAEAERVEAAAQSRCPLYLVGFSLGALVFEVLMNEEKMPVVFDKAVLFSPAFAIKGITRGVLLLGAMPGAHRGDGRIVKSAGPAEYRANTGASIAAYKALFALEKQLKALSFAKNNIPTLIFIDPRDELISYNKLKKLIKKMSLRNWTLQKVSNKGSRTRLARHHLIIDDHCLSKESWETVRRAMLKFLAE